MKKLYHNAPDILEKIRLKPEIYPLSQILTCSDLAEVAGSVRSISEHCMTANTDRNVDDWLSRAWLAEEVSQVQFVNDLNYLYKYDKNKMISRTASREVNLHHAHL